MLCVRFSSQPVQVPVLGGGFPLSSLSSLSSLLFLLVTVMLWAMVPPMPVQAQSGGQTEGVPVHAGDGTVVLQGWEEAPLPIYLPLILKGQSTGSAQVTPEQGGEAGYTPSQLHVKIPAGAVIGQSTLRIIPARAAPPAGLSDLNLLAEIELRDASGQLVISLGQPALVQFSYANVDLGLIDESSLAIHTQDGDGVWVKLPTDLDRGSRTASATVSHFSPFGLFGSPLVDDVHALALTVDARGTVIWFDFETFKILQKSPGALNSTVRSDLAGVHALHGYGDLDIDRATDTLYFTNGQRVYRIEPNGPPVAIYSPNVPGGEIVINGLSFNPGDGTLYVATDHHAFQMDPATGEQIRGLNCFRLGGVCLDAGVVDFRDVVVDAEGRVYATTREPARGSVTFSDWGNLYYWENGWLPVAYGFADPQGLAADDAGNVYVANFRGDAISVVSGADPQVVGVMRNIPFPLSLAVWGNTLVTRASRTISALPLTRRDGLPHSLEVASISPAGSLSGQGSHVVVQVSDPDPIPAHNVLRVGDRVIHEIASFAQDSILYQLPIELTPTTVARNLSIPSGGYRFSVGASHFSQGSLRVPMPGKWHFAQWYITDTIGVAQGDWLVWTISPGSSLQSLSSKEALFPPWNGSRGSWLTYQFNQLGRFTFTVTETNGISLTRYVEVTRTGPGNLGGSANIDPVQGGVVFSQGVRVEIPPGALPGSAVYTITVSNRRMDNPGPDSQTIMGYQYTVKFEPEPIELYKDIVLHLPYDPAALPEDPRAALFDPELEDFIPLDAQVADGYVSITLFAGRYEDPSTVAGAGESRGAQPRSADYWGQRLVGAINNVGKSLWWVVGLPNEKVENAYFVVLYNTRDGVSEAYAQKLLDALLYSRAVFDIQGYTQPSGQVIVKIAPWLTKGTQSEGFVPGIGTLGNWYMFFNDQLSDDEIKVTAAHEYFHILQKENMSAGARFITAPTWWLEGTATWAEYLVYPDIKSYHMRIEAGGDFVNIPFPGGWGSLDANQQYATVAFAIYLEKKVGGNTIKQIFGNLGVNTNLEEALTSVVGDLAPFYTEFAMDYWQQNYTPAEEWNLINFIPIQRLTSAETPIDFDGGGLTSYLTKIYSSGQGLPPSFTQASGSLLRAETMCEGEAGAVVHLLNAERKTILATFRNDADPIPSHKLSPLATYDLRNPLYLLFVNARPQYCSVTMVLETPTLSTLSPSIMSKGDIKVVEIRGDGFGNEAGSVSVSGLDATAEVVSWQKDRVFVTIGLEDPEQIGTLNVRVVHAEGISSNAGRVTVE
ncbi:MAG: hypothetical protein KJZ86_06915 [Caldilineaceae bacterium]|nr:hypothetical protein [Caldilineaceae bacterium]